MSDLSNHRHQQGSVQGHCSAQSGWSHLRSPSLFSATSGDSSSEPGESRSWTVFPWVGWAIWPRDFVKCCSLPFLHHGLGHLDSVCQDLWSGGCGAGDTETKRWSQEWMASVITQASWTSISFWRVWGEGSGQQGFSRGGVRDDLGGMAGALQGQDTEVCERTELDIPCSGVSVWPIKAGEVAKGRDGEFNNTNYHCSMYFCLRVF